MINMAKFVEYCPMRRNVRRLCVGEGSKPFNNWGIPIPEEHFPKDIIVYIEWEVSGNNIKLWKYKRGLSVMLINNNIMFNDDIKKEPYLLEYFGEEYDKFINYALEVNL